ncbi:MAG: hypothetical protein O7C98_06595, partial [Planctomycetota bacterium]|nr:hypothetical protein [Planctomycetota bacterium]
DPRLRTGGAEGKTFLPSGTNDKDWEVVFDHTFAEGDGKNEFVVVQESPIHYRMKKFETNPSAVASLQVSFAENAMNIVGEVLGAAAAVYGVPAVGILKDKLGTGGFEGEEDKAAALTIAQAQIAASKEIVAQRMAAENKQLNPLRLRLRRLADDARKLKIQLDAYSVRLGEQEAAVTTATTTKPAEQAKLAAMKKANAALVREVARIQQDAQSILATIETVMKAFAD